MDNLNKFNSRKLYLSIGVVVLSTTLLIFGYIPPEVWENVVIMSVIAYLTGNVAEKWGIKNATDPSERF